nr:NADH-quinone oxidoreductase subunit A [Candidatus Synchoanobacter obligatus]
MMEYLPIMLFLFLAMLVGGLPVILARIVAIHRPTKAKIAPFECGFPAQGSMRVPFDVRYYLVALLFILFDLETAFLFPWAVSLSETQWYGFFVMMAFLLILTIGFVFEWRHGALDWK